MIHPLEWSEYQIQRGPELFSVKLSFIPVFSEVISVGLWEITLATGSVLTYMTATTSRETSGVAEQM